MAVTNTAFAFASDSDTYRVNETPKKEVLKFRVASEYTGDSGSKGDQDFVTNDISERNTIRITSQFGRTALQRLQVIPNIIDDIKQKFSGVVTGIHWENEEFAARICDLSDPDKPDEMVTLSFDEIQDSDARQLAIGDSFLWYIGYVQGRMVSREGFSKIRFRRLPTWSQREFEIASSAAEELLHFFRKDTDTTT